MKKMKTLIIILFFIPNLLAQEYYFEWEKTSSYFPNNQKNKVAYINLGNNRLWGWVEITLTGSYSHRLSTGKYTKRYQVGRNKDNGYFHQNTEVPVAFGHVVSEWKLGEIQINEAKQMVIPIYHLLKTKNSIHISIRGINRTPFNYSEISISEVTTLPNNEVPDRAYLKQHLSIKKDLTVGTYKLNKGDKLTVAGRIGARELKVTVDAGADFVFNKDYDLMNLKHLEKYIKEQKHLPEIASEKEMKKNGLNLKDFSIKLLQKIEELTLYTIDQQKRIEKIEEENFELNEQKKRIKDLEERINSLLKKDNASN